MTVNVFPLNMELSSEGYSRLYATLTYHDDLITPIKSTLPPRGMFEKD